MCQPSWSTSRSFLSGYRRLRSADKASTNTDIRYPRYFSRSRVRPEGHKLPNWSATRVEIWCRRRARTLRSRRLLPSSALQNLQYDCSPSGWSLFLPNSSFFLTCLHLMQYFSEFRSMMRFVAGGGEEEGVATSSSRALGLKTDVLSKPTLSTTSMLEYCTG